MLLVGYRCLECGRLFSGTHAASDGMSHFKNDRCEYMVS